MPCYDPRGNESTHVDNQENAMMLSELRLKNRKLEAGLCAVINELEKKEITNDILSKASRRGLIDLMEFWESHSRRDYSRIARELHRYSEHEQDVMRKLLNQ